MITDEDILSSNLVQAKLAQSGGGGVKTAAAVPAASLKDSVQHVGMKLAMHQLRNRRIRKGLESLAKLANVETELAEAAATKAPGFFQDLMASPAARGAAVGGAGGALIGGAVDKEAPLEGALRGATVGSVLGGGLGYGGGQLAQSLREGGQAFGDTVGKHVSSGAADLRQMSDNAVPVIGHALGMTPAELRSSVAPAKDAVKKAKKGKA